MNDCWYIDLKLVRDTSKHSGAYVYHGSSKSQKCGLDMGSVTGTTPHLIYIIVKQSASMNSSLKSSHDDLSVMHSQKPKNMSIARIASKYNVSIFSVTTTKDVEASVM